MASTPEVIHIIFGHVETPIELIEQSFKLRGIQMFLLVDRSYSISCIPYRFVDTIHSFKLSYNIILTYIIRVISPIGMKFAILFRNNAIELGLIF